jgi:hypothetical protein
VLSRGALSVVSIGGLARQLFKLGGRRGLAQCELLDRQIVGLVVGQAQIVGRLVQSLLGFFQVIDRIVNALNGFFRPMKLKLGCELL